MLRKDAQGLTQRSDGTRTKGIMSLKRPHSAQSAQAPHDWGLGEQKLGCLGVLFPRAMSQISARARLLGSLLVGIKMKKIYFWAWLFQKMCYN